jgi:hypothetical protein
VSDGAFDGNAARLVPNNSFTTAFVSPSLRNGFEHTNAACPYADSSTQTMPNGLSFQIHCDSAVNAYTTDFHPGSNINGTAIPHDVHTESLDDCMQYCGTMRPTCFGVIYQPHRWANCLPLNRYRSQAKDIFAWDGWHVALAQFVPIDMACNNGSTSVGPTDRSTTFKVTCDHGASGKFESAVFGQNLNDCLEACTNTTSTDCAAVSFDATGNDGYENCYLLSSAHNDGSRPSWHFAQRVDNVADQAASSSSGDDETKDTGGGGSGSKAWIAGPVVGALAAIAALVFAAWWWRRRRRDESEKQLANASHRRSELDANFTERKELDTKHLYRDPAELAG